MRRRYPVPVLAYLATWLFSATVQPLQPKGIAPHLQKWEWRHY